MGKIGFGEKKQKPGIVDSLTWHENITEKLRPTGTRNCFPWNLEGRVLPFPPSPFRAGIRLNESVPSISVQFSPMDSEQYFILIYSSVYKEVPKK